MLNLLLRFFLGRGPGDGRGPGRKQRDDSGSVTKTLERAIGRACKEGDVAGGLSLYRTVNATGVTVSGEGISSPCPENPSLA